MSATGVFSQRSLVTCSLNNARDLSEVGNKAHNLSRMLKLGLNVPAGFMITKTAFDLFCEANGIDLWQQTKPEFKGESIPRLILDKHLKLPYAWLQSGKTVS